MKETAIEVTVFRKGMTLQEMNEFAQSIKAQYDQGYAHHEGFDAGDMAVIVMKREFDVAQELAPDFQSAAQTLDVALSQANQTIEYLRNEIAVLRQQNAGNTIDINAVSGTSLAESYNDLRKRLKEMEQQIANDGDAGLRTHIVSERL